MHAVLDELGKTSLPHHQALEVFSAKALAARDYLTAFKLADRRCRIEPPPLAHCYVLRADASFNLGDAIAARADLVDALRIVPDDLAALVNTFREIGFTRKQRLAVLYESDPHFRARLFAFIGKLRGWTVQAFRSFEDAIQWLSSEESTSTRLPVKNPGACAMSNSMPTISP
jgi:hypothetical protein